MNPDNSKIQNQPPELINPPTDERVRGVGSMRKSVERREKARKGLEDIGNLSDEIKGLADELNEVDKIITKEGASNIRKADYEQWGLDSPDEGTDELPESTELTDESKEEKESDSENSSVDEDNEDMDISESSEEDTVSDTDTEKEKLEADAESADTKQESVKTEKQPRSKMSVEKKAFKNKVEQKNAYEDFTRHDVAEMIKAGKTNEEIWEAAKEHGFFFKFDGSSYYQSDNGYWRNRSAKNNTSGGVGESKIKKRITQQIKHYRELDEWFGDLEDAFKAADILHANNVKSRAYMNKMEPMSMYWDEIKNAGGAGGEGEKLSNSKKKNMTPEQPSKETDNKSQEETDTSAEETEADDAEEVESQESTEEIQEGDSVYYMEKEMRRWRDPKEIDEIKMVEGEGYAKFADEDSLFPLSKLQKSESIDTDKKDYQPGPGNVAPSSEDLDSVPDASEVAQEVEDEMPEELANIPDAEVLAAEIEKMSPEEREKIDGFIQNLGHKTEQAKAWLQKKTYGFFADKLGGEDSDSTMGKWFSALNERAAAKEAQAIEARKERQNSDSKTKEFFKDKWKLTANVLKIGSMFFSPHRYFMMLGYGMSAGGEAGKEVRFDNEELLEQTRYKDAEKAAEEAWAVYEQAEKLSGGDDEVTKEILQDAYTKHLPENILKRLGEYEEFEDKTVHDIDKAHDEALRIQEEAESMAGENEVSTKDMQAAFEKLFEDPQPGQNTAFWGKLYEKQILRLVKKTQNKFLDIEMNDSLTEEEKEQEKQKYLNKWGRSKTLQDYDRMLTEQGKIDNWAMAAHEAQRAGQGFVGGAIAFTFWKGLSYLPDLFTSGDSVETTASFSDIGPEVSEDLSSIQNDSIGSMVEDSTSTVSAADSTGLEPINTDSLSAATADSTSVEAQGELGENINSAEDDTTVSNNTLQDSLNTTSVDSSSVETASQDTVSAADSSGLEPISTDSLSAATTDSSDVEVTEPDVDPSETGIVAEKPETAQETIGFQKITIDERGEGMIHAIADKLEDDFDLPHDKAMRIGNELYIKGEQNGGVQEMYNLVGEYSSFSLDFGEVTSGDLNSQSAEDLADKINFTQEEFDAGPSGVKGLELPEEEIAQGSDNVGNDNPYYGQENSIETRDADAVTIKDANEQAFEKQARDAGVIFDRDVPEPTNSNTPDTDIEQLRQEFEKEGFSIDQSQESQDTTNINNIDALRTNVDRIKVDEIQAMVAHMSAQSYVDSDFIDVPTEQLESLENFLEDNKRRPTSEIIQLMREESPESITAFERVMNLDDNGDTINRKALRPLYEMTQKLVSTLSPEDFANGVPEYARHSMDVSKIAMQS